MDPSPSTLACLADLAALGIDLEAIGNRIRFRPRSKMSADLLRRVKDQELEILALMDANVGLAGLRRFVTVLWQDPAWRQAWEQRFRQGKYADFESLRRVLELVITQAEEHHRRRDWAAFASTSIYMRRLAQGELWDDAARKIFDFQSDLTVFVI